MIKEVLEKKIEENISPIREAIIDYVGEEYRYVILEKMKRTMILLVNDNGVFREGRKEFYIGEEPICVKDKENSYVLLPLSLFKDKRGNIIFVHNLLHALGENNLDSEGFNEVVIDYMANEIGKKLESEKINITLDETPNYSSNSFYSHLFPLVEPLFKDNKDNTVKSVIGNKCYLNKEDVYRYSESIKHFINKEFEVNKEFDTNKKR